MIKFGDSKIETRIKELIKDQGQPVSIDWVAQNIGIGWDTARSILLNMALNGDIRQ